MSIGLKPNVSTNPEDPHNSVYTTQSSAFGRGSQTVTICIGVLIASSVILLCTLLCYKELQRRRKMMEENGEKARRENIRQNVRLKLQELEHLTDSASISEQSELKTPLVTFGDVVTISPAQSPVQARKPTKYTRHQNEYYFLQKSFLHFDRKRRVNHIPSRPINGQLSYRQQQKIRSVQRHLNGHDLQEVKVGLQSTPSNDYIKLQVTSIKHTNNGIEPAVLGDRQDSPSRNGHSGGNQRTSGSQPRTFRGHLV